MKVDIFNTNKKYSIIYADPPWQYKVWSNKGHGRSAESHYPTMTKIEIQNLPIPKICENNSVLFLWVTYPCLEEGLELIKKWGFTYKTCGFSWVKLNKRNSKPFIGMGYYPPFNFKRTGCKGCPYSLDLQEQLDIMGKYLPEEKRQCERIWKPVYDEYRRINFRLKNQTTIFDFISQN